MAAPPTMRRRMRSSRLTGPPLGSADQAVRWHAAMQAQDYGPAKWSVGQRSRGVADEDVDRAVADGSVIRTHVLRPTWHFVAREDLRWLLALTGPRVQGGLARRYRELGLDGRTLGRSERLIAAALEGGNHLTRGGMAPVLARARIDTAGQRLPHILLHCELEAVICSGPRAGKQHSYALLDERVPADRGYDRDTALADLTRRYLSSHAPATIRDLSWWSSLTMTDIRKALHDLGSDVRSETADGLTLWSLSSGPTRVPSVRGAHLLQAFDELIVGYTESRYLGDPRAPAVLAAWRDRSVPIGVMLLNGGLAGHWRRTIERSGVRVEVFTYGNPTAADRRAVEAAARRLGRFVGRPVDVDVRPL